MRASTRATRARPCSGAATALAGGAGFSGFSKAKRQLDQAVAEINGGKPIAPWTIHDLRRYVSTTLNERLGVEPHVVEAILAHYPKGVAGTYNRAAYALEKRRALDKLANHLEAVKSAEPAEAKVVSLGKGKRLR